MKKSKKLIGSFIGVIGAAVIIALGVTTLKTNLVDALTIPNTTYYLTLNSSNKVTSDGDVNQQTALKNKVTFTYAGVSASTTGHVTLNNEGSLVNKDWIRSISAFTCTFSSTDSLSAKFSFGGNTWNSGFELESGKRYETASNPYFIKFISSGTTTISSISYEYTCLENSAAHENEGPGESVTLYRKVTQQSEISNGTYLIVYEVSSSSAKILDGNLTYSNLDATSNYVTASISEGTIATSSSVDSAAFTVASMTGGYSFKSTRNYYIYHTGSKNTLDTSSSAQANTIEIDSSTSEATISYSSYTIKFNTTVGTGDRFRYYSAAVSNVYLYKRVTEQQGPTYDVPVDCIGFTATDSNANNYKTTDVYDTANGLTVTAHYSDSTSLVLSKGGEDGYSYVVKDSNNNPIDTSKAFGGESDGTYTVIVYYKDFIPVGIAITTQYVIAMTDIQLHSTTLTFNTAQKLSDFTSGITADLTYNKTSENLSNVSFVDLASKDVSIALIKPNGTSHELNVPFGVAGDNWKIKATYNQNPAVYSELTIVVNAIPVTNISVSAESSTTIEEGDTVQLTVSVSPNNATNQNVTWTSSYEGVATVDASGLVTAVSASINNGVTTITATAQDGSLVFGSIEVTVTAKSVPDYVGTYSLLSGSLNVGDYVVFASSGNNGSAYACGDKSGNVRNAISTTISSGKITVGENSSITGFLVCEGAKEGTYAFYDPIEKGYLCASSSSSNYVDIQETLNNNGSWSVSGTSSATVTAQGSYTKNIFKYNYPSGSTPRFTCYASNSNGPTLPALFVKAGQTIYPNSLSVSAASEEINVGGTTQLTVGYLPANTTYKEVTYSSSSESIATVSSTGLVTGVGEGTATITVTGNNGSESIHAYIDITVNYVYVTSVEIVSSSTSVSVGNTLSLSATVNPSNATNKNVTWSSSNTSIATVSSTGVVTPKEAGDVTITVTTESTKSDKTTHATASIEIHVTAGGSPISGTTDVIDHSETNSELGSVGSTTWHEFTINGASGTVYSVKSMGLNGDSRALRWNTNGYLYTSTSSGLKIVSVTVQSNNTIGIGVSNSVITDKTGSETTTISSGTFTPTGEYEYLRVWGTTSSTLVTSIEIVYTAPEPVNPTGISISPSEVNLAPGGSKNLTVNYVPNTANQNLEVDWSSSASNIVSVDSTGRVTANSNATEGQSAVITARLHNLTTIYATKTVNIVAASEPKQTIMIYMCGSDLESGYDDDTGSYSAENGSQGTLNIGEILSVANQPDDVNIILETGGSKYWYNDYGMNANKIERWHVENQTLVKDASMTRTNMADPATFQSFMEWGLANYPAQRTGVILWDHGNGMQGCCSDEYNSSWDMLTEAEVKSALTNAYSNKNVSGKLEWIGYDCCLMAMQDIASINADYFNYQISSQESEPGAGWDYDGFIASLYEDSSISTVDLLKSVCDTYKTKVRATYDYYATLGNQYKWYANFEDTTLAVFDLAYMDAYVSAWEAMVTNLAINSQSKFDTLADHAKECYAFANGNDNGYGTGTSQVDAYDAYTFLNRIKNNYSNSGAANVQAAFNNVVIYKVIGFTYENHAYGMSVFVATYGNTYAPLEYTANDTKFSKWRTINLNYGTWYVAS